MNPKASGIAVFDHRFDLPEYERIASFPRGTTKFKESKLSAFKGGVINTRELMPGGITRLENRKIPATDPIFLTGEGLLARRGNTMLIRVIPPDGIPGWVELRTTSIEEWIEPIEKAT